MSDSGERTVRSGKQDETAAGRESRGRHQRLLEGRRLGGASGIQMAPHACEGPVGAIASMHVDAAMPNFLVQEICSGVEPEEKEGMWEDIALQVLADMIEHGEDIPEPLKGLFAA